MAGEGVMKIELRDTLSTDITDLPGEIWEDIPGFEDRYQVSNYSRVKSILCRKPRIIKKTISNGRWKVFIYNKRGIGKNEESSRVAATVFIRPPEDNEVIKFKDKNPLNDALHNLEWISKKESAINAYNSGRFPVDHGRALKNGMTILNHFQVSEIRKGFSQGFKLKELAAKYNVSESCISGIVKNKRWKHID